MAPVVPPCLVLRGLDLLHPLADGPVVGLERVASTKGQPQDRPQYRGGQQHEQPQQALGPGVVLVAGQEEHRDDEQHDHRGAGQQRGNFSAGGNQRVQLRPTQAGDHREPCGHLMVPACHRAGPAMRAGGPTSASGRLRGSPPPERPGRKRRSPRPTSRPHRRGHRGRCRSALPGWVMTRSESAGLVCTAQPSETCSCGVSRVHPCGASSSGSPSGS